MVGQCRILCGWAQQEYVAIEHCSQTEGEDDKDFKILQPHCEGGELYHVGLGVGDCKVQKWSLWRLHAKNPDVRLVESLR